MDSSSSMPSRSWLSRVEPSVATVSTCVWPRLNMPEPVSYTHLDVYKRQVLQRSRPFWSASRISGFGYGQVGKLPSGSLCSGTTVMSFTPMRSRTVSYTHLLRQIGVRLVFHKLLAEHAVVRIRRKQRRFVVAEVTKPVSRKLVAA